MIKKCTTVSYVLPEKSKAVLGALYEVKRFQGKLPLERADMWFLWDEIDESLNPHGLSKRSAGGTKGCLRKHNGFIELRYKDGKDRCPVEVKLTIDGVFAATGGTV